MFIKLYEISRLDTFLSYKTITKCHISIIIINIYDTKLAISNIFRRN